MSETFISVDVEASGPIPGEYSLLSIGACVVGATEQNFYVELKPITKNFQPEAMEVCGLNLDELARSGVEPQHAMSQFENWLRQITPRNEPPIFVAYPVAFDWMFVAYYFERFLRRNPFGYSGVDVKSFYMGMMGTGWSNSHKGEMEAQFHVDFRLTHNAREDAIVQADLFERLLEYRRKTKDD